MHEYEQSKHISAKGYHFYTLMAALMRAADDRNTDLLRAGWPDIYESLVKRYNAPMGVIEDWDGFTAEEYYGRLCDLSAEREGDEDEPG